MQRFYTHLASLVLTSIVAITTQAQTTYYTCTTAPSNNYLLTTDSTGGGTCNVDSATWNQIGNTVKVLSNTSYFTTYAPHDVECHLEVMQGGTLSLEVQGPNKDMFFTSNSSLHVYGRVETGLNLGISNEGLWHIHPTGEIDDNGSANNDITIGGSGTVIIEGTIHCDGDITIEGDVWLTGSLVATDIIINGTVTGDGNISSSNNLTGTGTVNGFPPSQLTPPLDLDSIGYVWSGTTWTSKGTNTPLTKSALTTIDRAFLEGTDYNTSINGDLKVGDLFISSGKLTVAAGDSVISSNSIKNQDSIILYDHAILECDSIVTGTGGIFRVERSINRSGWHFFGFPSSSNTVSDISSENITLDFSQTASHNCYTWDATSSVWKYVNATDLIGDETIVFYSDTNNAKLSLDIPNNHFNIDPVTRPIAYHDPGPPVNGSTSNGTGWASSATDGWNLIHNPYQSFIDLDKLDITGMNSAIYVYDGTTYKSYTQHGTGDDEAHFISPHQGFFIQSNNTSNSLIFNTSARTATPNTYSNLFKTGEDLQIFLRSADDTVWTWISEHNSSSNRFDSEYDAYYLEPWDESPMFFSTNRTDSVSYHIQTVPSLSIDEVILSFNSNHYDQEFTIELPSKSQYSANNLILTDLFTGTQTNLLESNYSFVHNANAPIQRFQIEVTDTFFTGVNESTSHDDVRIWSNGERLFTNSPLSYIYVYNISGQLLGTFQNIEDVQTNEGLLILRVQNQQGIFSTHKILSK